MTAFTGEHYRSGTPVDVCEIKNGLSRTSGLNRPVKLLPWLGPLLSIARCKLMYAKVSLIKPRPIFSKALAYLELIPCPLAFWRSDDRFCIINLRTTQLTGYSADELRQNSSLWLERIHSDDRPAYSEARSRLQNSQTTCSLEYRFFPKGQSKEKWISETSLALRGEHGRDGIISVYQDISRLRELQRRANPGGPVPEGPALIAGLIHELENHLQVIKGSLDLLRLNYMKATAVSLAETGVERTTKLLREVENFVAQPKRERSRSNPAAILKELCRCMERELRSHNIAVNLLCTDSLPDVWVNPEEFRSALYTVVDFSRVLLPQGGEVTIEALLHETDGERHVELVVSSCGAVFASVTEEDVFRPFLKINGNSIGLSMVLAQQILARQDGNIVFEKQAKSRGIFTIRLRADWNSDDASKKV